MSIRQEIDQINKDIDKLIEERKLLQESCKHIKKEEVDYMWRPGAIDKVVMCVECDKIIRNVAEQYIESEITFPTCLNCGDSGKKPMGGSFGGNVHYVKCNCQWE